MGERRRPLRGHLSYANVMSCLALFLLLAGGTAFAARLAKDSVVSKTVRDNSLSSADLANGKGVSGADVTDDSLGGADVADGSLGSAEVADGSLTAAAIAAGSLGGSEVGAGTIGGDRIAPESILSGDILDNTIQGADVAADAITGDRINEPSLGSVPSAFKLAGVAPSGLLSQGLYVVQSSAAETQPDGTVLVRASCRAGDFVLSGGVTGVNKTSDLLESLRVGGFWAGRIDPNGGADIFVVVAICATKLP